MIGVSWVRRVYLIFSLPLYRGVNTYGRLKITLLDGIHQFSREGREG